MNPDLREKNQNLMQTKSKTKKDLHKGEIQGIKVDEPKFLSLAQGSAHQPKGPRSLFWYGLYTKLRIHFLMGRKESEEENFIIHEKYVKSKFQCP